MNCFYYASKFKIKKIILFFLGGGGSGGDGGGMTRVSKWSLQSI